MQTFILLGVLLSQVITMESIRFEKAIGGQELKFNLKYPFELPKAKKHEFLEKVTTLKAGDSIQRVVKVLGPPMAQYQIADKGKYSKVRGVMAMYDLKKVGWGQNLFQDQYVHLIYDNDLLLTRIDTNIRGLRFGSITSQNLESSTIEADALPLAPLIEKR